MSEVAEPTVAGELVVQNGRHKGQRIPLAVPVTVIGSADWCDVRLSGDGVGEVHCVITVTPAGPALRTWHPDQTRVNAEPVTARLLRNGDALTVGPCRFKLAWYYDDLVPLTPADGPEPQPPECEVLLVPEGAFDLVAWQRSLHSQERALADLIDARHRQFSEWFEELADRREELRLYRARQDSYVADDRAEAKRLREEARRHRDAARKDRRRARALYGRFLKRMKHRWSAERKAVEAERAELARTRRQVAEESARFEAEYARFSADATAYQKRLQDAWELLTDGQRRLLADRQESERTIARQQEALDRRTADLKAQQQALASARERVEGRVQDLLAEIARLETRAAHARAVVQSLEEKRSALEAGAAVAVGTVALGPPDPFADRVALDEPPGGVEELMTGLMTQRQELDREKRSLAAARAELERRAGDLADQRAVLAEQLAALVVVKQRWQATEFDTVGELEALVRDLGDRELAIEDRERELGHVEASLKRRAADLDGLRRRLEAWQAALAAHETTAASARDRAEAELAAKREHLMRWETALATLCRKWSAARKSDLERIREEVSRWSAAREAYRARQDDLDAQQKELVAVAARLAAVALAVQQTEQKLLGGDRPRLARRALRVHRRQWESHFGKLLKDLSARRAALADEWAAADDRYRALMRMAAEAAERRAAVTDEEQAAEAGRLARERELDERAATLSIEAERARRTEQELTAVRAEVERVTAALMSGETPERPALEEPVLLSLPARAA
jgi:hypothetical protein